LFNGEFYELSEFLFLLITSELREYRLRQLPREASGISAIRQQLTCVAIR